MALKLRIAVIIALFLSASASVAATFAPPGDRASSTTIDAASYKLGVGDKLRVTVYNETSLSGEFAVAANGSISIPLIGEVPVENRTVVDVAGDVRARLADGYLRDPHVSAEVVAYRPFYILGEVRSPGSYPYVIGLTALNAIATAQGFTPRADRRKIFIRRLGEEQEQVYEMAPNLRIFPGDTIRLGERYF